MAMHNIFFRCRVAEQPAHGQLFHNHELVESVSSESFNVYFCIRFTLYSESPLNPINNMPPLHTSQSISCERFFLDGPTFLRSNLSHPLIPPHTLEEMIPNIMSRAQNLYSKYRSSYYGDHSFAVYPLAVDVEVEIPDIGELFQRIVRDFMQDQVRMVPASEEAIASLSTMKIEDTNVGANAMQCCICLEEYDEGAEVSRMPCAHVFHHDCVTQWLKTSHLCPICRYEMPM